MEIFTIFIYLPSLKPENAFEFLMVISFICEREGKKTLI